MSDEQEPLEVAWEEVNPPPEPPSLEEMEEAATIIHLDRFPEERVVGGGLIIAETPEQEEGFPDLNKFPIRTELTVLPADEVRQPLALRFYERTPEELAERDSPENLAALKAQREATDVADSYISSHGIAYETLEGYGWFSLPVLQELWGTPWNNAATNFLRCLRPTTVRVTTGNVTLDSMPWRVTVLLNGNRRTIQSIYQEVEVSLTGFRNGVDANNYLRDNSRELETPQPQAVVNLRGVRNLSIHREEDS
jgi:hypothetical protein